MKQNSTHKIRVFGNSFRLALLVMLTALNIFSNTKAQAQQTLYGISGWQDTAATLYKLDPNTGAVIGTIGNTGLSFVTNMTINPLTGEIYVQNSQLVDSAMVNGQMEYYWQGMYYLVDSITAVPTFVATTTTDTTYSALEPPYIIYSPNGNTYTIDLLCQCPRDFIGVVWSNVCNLYFKDEFYISQIDTMTGGLLNYAQVMGVAHNMLTLNINDVIYSGERLSNGFMLKTISPDFNTFTATLTDIGQSPVMNMAAIAFGRYQPTITASNTLNFCVGGSVTLTSSTADGYQWKLNGVDIPNATQQTYEATQSGDYTVEVTLGCGRHLSNAATVTVNPLPVLSTAVTNVTCFGLNNGSIDLSVAGSGSFMYNWSNGAGTQDLTNLAPGTYNVTVTSAFGCSASTSATITQPSSALIASSGGQTDPTSGNNGSAIVVASGGTPPYTYNWSPAGGTDDTATGLGAGTYTATVTDANGCTASQSFTLTQACNISFTGDVTNVACNGQSNGAIDITITSGAGSYSYSWSNGATTQDISNLAAGTYTVTVSTSNGCSYSQSFTVAEPETLAITAGVNNVSCYGANNGSIDVTVTGGTAPYTYKWADVNSSNFILWIIFYMNQWCNTNNSSWPGSNINSQDRAGLENGCYYVKVTDANGCTAIASFTVSEPGPICVSHTKNNAGCANNNGSINQSVSGGTAPYTYLWSNGATTEDVSGLSAGTYSVVITDANGCTDNKSYSISQASSNISITHTKCNAQCTSPTGSINISVSGSTSYTYQWSNGATTQDVSGLVPGTYTVVVTGSNGCTATQSFTIGSTSGDYNVSYTKCNANCANTNGSINISVYGGNSPYTYQWSNGATTQDISGLSAGTYTVVVTDENGCQETRTYTISQADADFYVSVNKCNANCANTNGSINISVSGGNAPYTYQWSNGATTQDIYNLSAGTYTVVITDASGCTETKSYTIYQSSGNLNASISVSPVYPVSGQDAYTIYLGYGTQCVTLSASISGGTGPYTKVWSTSQTSSTISVSPTVTTTYTLTVTDANGCTDVATRTIIVKNVQAPNNKIYVCHNGTTTSVYSSQVYNHLCHGDDLGQCNNYYNNCRTTGEENTEPEQPAQEPTFAAIAQELEFSVYPNPSDGQFTIDIPTLGDLDIMVTDIAGKVVDRKFIKDNTERQLKYNLVDAPKGVYMIRVATEGEVYQTKITLQ